MVMPADGAAPNSPRASTLAELIGQTFGAKATPAPESIPVDKTREPKDDPDLIAKYAVTARAARHAAGICRECGCLSCQLEVRYHAINQHLCAEMVTAATSGDHSKLRAVFDFIDDQLAPRPSRYRRAAARLRGWFRWFGRST